MARPKVYVGLNNEVHGGMTPLGKVIRDAQVFSIIEETETCEGWNYAQIDGLLNKVNNEWDKYGCLVSHLPSDLMERHQRIHNQGMKNAQKAGWSGEIETDDEN